MTSKHKIPSTCGNSLANQIIRDYEGISPQLKFIESFIDRSVRAKKTLTRKL